MLCNLDIKNIAVIEELSFDPGNGMTVLIGETGAGKSVIIDSVNLILGARTNKNLVRYGEKSALVSAMFTLNDELKNIFEENGISTEEQTFIISREITSDAKSITRVNGTMVPLTFLRDISHFIINIHGQHDNQALLNPQKHIDFLDSFADNKELLNEYTFLYLELKKTENEYKKLILDEQERISRIDFLNYQVDELVKADLKPGEKEELVTENNLISNSEKISDGVKNAYLYLYDDDRCAYNNINKAISSLSYITSYNDELMGIYERLNEAYYTIEDVAHELRNFSEKIEFNPQRQNEICERLDIIKKLERKYGGSVENCLDFLKKSQNELEILESSDEKATLLALKIENITHKLTDLAKKLSEKRIIAAKKLSVIIEKEIHDLDMEKALFKVDISKSDILGPKGFDCVEFIFSANPGQPQKPLTEIASGGELSRVMLALKSVLADSDSTDTLIFDEIDTGVSGNAAQKIAKKLSALGNNKQVICISHQPQLAAAADNQFRIEKNISDNNTRTTIKLLDNDERIEALAAMIDGKNITETSLKHAREMLERGF